MGQYVILFRGSEPPEEELERIASAPGVTLIDRTLNRAMLLEGSEEAMASLAAELRGWLVAERVSYAQPESVSDIREDER